jgi:hypothetical protein
MSPRTIIGILVGITFVAAVVYLAMGQFDVKCEVCITYRGRQLCETALAADRDQAVMQATSSACTQLTNGVNEVMECQRLRATSLSCNQ